MGSPDLPAWLQVGTGVASLFLGLSNRRQKQARDWGQTLEELADLDKEELRRIVEDNPTVAEIVGDAWEEAAKTASEDKRYLLARVAAAALRGDTTPGQVDALQLLLRTVIGLDSMHVALLVAMSTTMDGRPRAAFDPQTAEEIPDDAWPILEEVQARWPSPPDLLGPALSTLEREGLIARPTLKADGSLGWGLTSYGRRFIDHLLIDAGGWPPQREIQS